MDVRVIDPSDLHAAAAFVAKLQGEPSHHIGYYDTSVDALVEQMSELEPLGAGSVVAAYEDGAIVGLLQAEWDTEPPRVWWHGPLVDASADWDGTADALYGAASRLLPAEVVEEELSPDGRNERVATFATRHGFGRDPASAVLTRSLAEPPGGPEVDGVVTRAFGDGDRAAVAALHDQLFPRTHVPGHRIDEGDDRVVLVAERAGDVVGYVAAERQEDGQGYIDFLGVVPDERSRGIGQQLVADACRRLGADGSDEVHLTVREDNTGARRLYEWLGFTEERIIVPWRKGWSAA